MSRLMTVESDADVTVTVHADVQHLCPFVDEVDSGSAEITWRCAGHTIELHALRGWLDGFASATLSHEELTDLLRHELSTLPGVELLNVETDWTTAGMGVKCATSPTRRLSECERR